MGNYQDNRDLDEDYKFTSVFLENNIMLKRPSTAISNELYVSCTSHMLMRDSPVLALTVFHNALPCTHVCLQTSTTRRFQNLLKLPFAESFPHQFCWLTLHKTHLQRRPCKQHYFFKSSLIWTLSSFAENLSKIILIRT